ncbi:MAG TPA: type VI secretion system baseplate subunit TssG [Polyangiaceae bacterium]|nr:type VI secretion system baseplate subunit TssG [Polyangiaceae bacterium]
MSARTATKEPPWLLALEERPFDADFHLALRRLECLYPERPRLGEGMRPSDEPVRIGQDPSTAFAPSAISAFQRPKDGMAARLAVAFMGMFGPRGALPLHLTEYARDRLRNAGDPTFARFVDIFHHRMLVLFHRAWAAAQPTACQDRPSSNRFTLYVGALFGLGLRATLERDRIPDRVKLHYASRLAAPARNAEGLEAMVADYFGLRAWVEPFVGEWITLPPDGRWKLGYSRQASTLGSSTILGARIWQCEHKFRIVLGPLTRAQFHAMLPGSDSLATLASLVRSYVGDELDWEARLVLADGESLQLRLGGGTRLGWNTHLGRRGGAKNEDLVVHPRSGRTQRMDRARTAEPRPC